MANLIKDDRTRGLNEPDAATVTLRSIDKNKQIEKFLDPRAFGLVKAAYSVKETLELLSIGRTTFYELVDREDLKITKLGRKTLVYAAEPMAPNDIKTTFFDGKTFNAASPTGTRFTMTSHPTVR
jgi:excisionase family DNA binding protein